MGKALHIYHNFHYGYPLKSYQHQETGQPFMHIILTKTTFFMKSKLTFYHQSSTTEFYSIFVLNGSIDLIQHWLKPYRGTTAPLLSSENERPRLVIQRIYYSWALTVLPMACSKLLLESVVSWVSSQIIIPPSCSNAYCVFFWIVGIPL